MAQESKAGGDFITSFQQFVREFYLFGLKENRGNYLERSSCISMYTSVSLSH